MKEEILTANNLYLENQGNMFIDMREFKKSTFLLRLEGFWNNNNKLGDRDKIMEFIKKELETL